VNSLKTDLRQVLFTSLSCLLHFHQHQGSSTPTLTSDFFSPKTSKVHLDQRPAEVQAALENIDLMALEDIDLGNPDAVRFETRGMLGVSVRSLPPKYAVKLTIPERYRGL
jgi:hypothetical protein